MGLTSVGIGSGIDINGIVSALVNAESAGKISRFDVNEGLINAEISAIGSLKSAVSEFQDKLEALADPDSFTKQKVSLSDSTYYSASADDTAVAGSYEIEVEQLAKSQKVGSVAVADATAVIGEGSINIDVGGSAFDVAVDADDTLESLMAKINDSNDNTGVTATIINGDNGPQLVMTSNTTGTDKLITVTGTDTDGGTGVADTFTMSQLSAAQDSIVYIDGLKVTSGTNSVEGAITGVSLSLKDADIAKTTTLSIAADTDSIKSKITSFVEAYNSLNETMAGLTGYDPDTQQAGALQGDSLPRSLKSQINGIMSSSFSFDGGNLMLATIGITTTRDGSLEIDSTELSAAISDNISGIQGMFSTEETGLANQLETLTSNYIQSGGIFDGRDESLTSQMERITESREALNTKMSALEARLLKQFNAMDLVVGSLNAQSEMLQSRLDSLPGMVKS